ncbi:MAG: cell division protein FtsQ/DivIB [Ottowia sp.]|nr:cell division protein FtsQ/DivIB [Ottowia sp.]
MSDARVSLPPDVRRMNATADLVYGALTLVVLGALLLWALRQPAFAIAHIVVRGDTTHSSAASLRASVLPRLQGNFFTLDLAAVQRAFQDMPWVRHATVQREFPGRLNVTLQEHVPVARWGSEGAQMLNAQGEIFEVGEGEIELAARALPQLGGPDGKAGQVLAMYQRLAPLAAPLNLPMTGLQMHARGGWRARLGNGAGIELGKGAEGELAQRLERFAATAAQVAARHKRDVQSIESADLRYNSGYAIRLRGVGTVGEEERQRAGAGA